MENKEIKSEKNISEEKKVEVKSIKKSNFLLYVKYVIILIIFIVFFNMININSDKINVLKNKVSKLNDLSSTNNFTIDKLENKISKMEKKILVLECGGDIECLKFISEFTKECGKKLILKEIQCPYNYEEDLVLKVPENLNSYKICKENEIKDSPSVSFDKPIIYLYPQKKQKIKVQLDYKGKIIADYPKYDEKIKGWEIEAYPDSRIIDLRDGEEYSYLFWEGIPNKKIDWNLDKGFIVEGKNARKFLKEKLKYLGLTPKEYNEFIVYWYPKMMNNKYNLVHFATKKYTESAPLKVSPKPDSMLRVFMVMKKLDKKIEIKTQKLEKFERKGFAVVEWGGSEIK